MKEIALNIAVFLGNPLHSHFVMAAIALYPLWRIYRRAGLQPWPIFGVMVPLAGWAIALTPLALRRWKGEPAPVGLKKRKKD